MKGNVTAWEVLKVRWRLLSDLESGGEMTTCLLQILTWVYFFVRKGLRIR